MSENTLLLVDRIRKRIRRAGWRITTSDLLFGSVVLLGGLAGYLLVAAAVEVGFWLDAPVRSAVFWTMITGAAAVLVYFVGFPLLRYFGILPGLDEETVARRVGLRFPEVSDRLVNLLHLTQGRRSEAPEPFIDRAVRSLGEEVSALTFERVDDYGRARSAGKLATVPVFGLLLFFLVLPGPFMDATHRLFSPGMAFERPAPFTLSVEPGSVEIVRGATLGITATTAGSQIPNNAELLYRQAEEAYTETVTLSSEKTGVFSHQFVNVRQPMEYQVVADNVKSPWYGVEVIERPTVRGLKVGLRYPSYTRIPPRQLDPNVGDVTALRGTQVQVEVLYGGHDVAEAVLVFDDGDPVPMSVEDGRASASFSLRQNGTYHISLRNEADVENENPITYSLTTLSDEYPSITIAAPSPNETLTESLQTPVQVRITDDYGFSQLKLFYRLAESRFGNTEETYEAIDLPLDDRYTLDQSLRYDWDIVSATGLSLVPGDVIEYYIKVWDNDAVSGFKGTASSTQLLRFPSITERYEELNRRQDDFEGELRSLLDESESVRDQFQELQNELRSKQETGWEDERQLERLMEQQTQLEERVEQLSDRIESMSEQMQNNRLVSDDTLQMYEQLQKVIEEINSPELMEALRQLQEAMNQLDLRQMQNALQEFDFNEEQYRQRLERALELFQDMRLQQRLDEAARRAEDLAQRQEQLSEETSNLQEDRDSGEASAEEQQDRADDLAQQQREAAQDMEALQESLEELREQMEESRRAPKERMDETLRNLDEQQIPQQMQQNTEMLEQLDLDNAFQGQCEMQENLQKLSQDLSDMMQQMSGERMQLNIQALRKSLYDVLTLSHKQEALREDVRQVGGDSPVLRDKAQQQVELSRGFSSVSDTLQSISRQIPQMSREIQRQSGRAMIEMDRAVESLAERRSSQAGSHQTQSMAHLNELAVMLANLLEQLQNMQGQGSGEGMSLQQMIEQLQQMAGDQQEINQQIQDLLNDIQGERLSQDQQQRLQQIRAQQERMRRQLSEMSRSGHANELLGDLERIAEQMEDSIREMEAEHLDRRLVQRQQQILTRLLDAQRSLQTRGEEEERKARTAEEQHQRESPAGVTPEDTAERLRRDLIRALESGYAPDYEEIIKRYFELLQREEGR